MKNKEMRRQRTSLENTKFGGEDHFFFFSLYFQNKRKLGTELVFDVFIVFKNTIFF